MSEISTPITVRKARNIRNEPARYMSWLCNALISIGPVVSSDSTIAVISAPEMIAGRIEPISATKKFSAMRSGYFTSALNGCRPLARAVTTYCFCNSSSRLARRRRIMPAVPGSADDDDGYPEMREDRRRLVPAHRLRQVFLVHQMADRSAEPDIGEIHQDQRQHEIRDGDADQAQEGQAVIPPAILVGCRIDADREGD